MLARVFSGATLGVDAYLVEVEADVAKGLPSFSTVGLPDNAVKESKDRIKSAVKNSGYSFPARRITVNLAPADVKKEGTSFDLPAAVAILKAVGAIKKDSLEEFIIIGELSLDGRVKPVRGALPVAVFAKALNKKLILPIDNGIEASIVSGLEVYGVKALSELVEFLNGTLTIEPNRADLSAYFRRTDSGVDISDVRGQAHVKRALEVAAAGGHNILMMGPPGAGKTMLARRFSTILPDMTLEESIETTKVHSVAGVLTGAAPLVTERPFRSPHHTISDIGLIGGGRLPRPGEVSLAHNGVLFLDEMPEFGKKKLEVLRQPIEDGCVSVTRSSITVSYPAVFTLIGAMNPCPCGYLGDAKKECVCAPKQVEAHRARLSGPLLDRIDIHCEVPQVRFRHLKEGGTGETSLQVRGRVNNARAVQSGRFKGAAGGGFFSNSRMGSKQIKELCQITKEGERLLEAAVERLGFSARAYTRVLKVARTIADLEGEKDIAPHHISEAVQYRTLDRPIS